MAITSLRGSTNNYISSRLKRLLTQGFFHTLRQAETRPNMVPDSVPEEGLVDMSKWRKMDSRVLGIKPSMISQSSWTVLKILQREGFEAYLVGGCVRDLILKKTPKDFDVITTANLKQIKQQFRRAYIVGQRFPICIVNIRGSAIEVSSFETVAKNCDKEEIPFSQMPVGCDKKDYIRWRNSLHRDYTINSLFFDPLLNKVYDYANGMADLRSLKLRSLIPAKLSFTEDCARILRGLRIAARLSLTISKSTEAAIHRFSSSILSLGKGRIMMEMNYMLSYGAAGSSLSLLWRFNLLRVLLPVHAAYLDQQIIRDLPQNSTMLMKLFLNLDKLVTVDRPSDCSLWVSLLVFHMALANHPQDNLVVLTFASVLYHGGWRKGLDFARANAQEISDYVPEISSSSACKSDVELEEEVSGLASLVIDSIAPLSATESLVKLMSRYPESSCSGVVFVPNRHANSVAEIFIALAEDIRSYKKERMNYEIDYHLLGKGFLYETRFVLGKIILETLNCRTVKKEVVQEDDYQYRLQERIKENGSKGKKRGLTLDIPVPKQGSVKKHKSGIDKREVNETLSPQRDLISVLGHELGKQTCQMPEEEVIEKTQEDKATKQQLKTVKKHNVSQKEWFEPENTQEASIENVLKMEVSKSGEDRQVSDQENGGLSLSSSLFNGEKLHKRGKNQKLVKCKQVASKEEKQTFEKRKQVADKKEKSSSFRLSSLFKSK